jgi:hypothetical protein
VRKRGFEPLRSCERQPLKLNREDANCSRPRSNGVGSLPHTPFKVNRGRVFPNLLHSLAHDLATKTKPCGAAPSSRPMVANHSLAFQMDLKFLARGRDRAEWALAPVLSTALTRRARLRRQALRGPPEWPLDGRDDFRGHRLQRQVSWPAEAQESSFVLLEENRPRRTASCGKDNPPRSRR